MRRGSRGTSYPHARPCLLTRETCRGRAGRTTLWEHNGAPRYLQRITDAHLTVSAILRHMSRKRSYFRKRRIRSHDARSFRRCTYDIPHN
ncbi:hypothetical protein NDU88_005229 [Pleurodeles waltl]|uniref:Uncharacterized protein n=1 Tax=Pleurodeles waltl TaxID=8319 RepID=A0AAV7QF20_PLEWA|nr:hypothetical protein NDU88_005229 [Pleurodeles waltl]